MANVQFKGGLRHTDDERGSVVIEGGEVMSEEEARDLVPREVLRDMYDAGLIKVVLDDDDKPFGPDPTEVPEVEDVVFAVEEDEEDEDSTGSPSPEE